MPASNVVVPAVANIIPVVVTIDIDKLFPADPDAPKTYTLH